MATVAELLAPLTAVPVPTQELVAADVATAFQETGAICRMRRQQGPNAL